MRIAKFFILLIIYLAIIGSGSGKVAGGDIEWVDPQENMLSLAENFTRDNFIIEATDFYEGSVLITIYDDANYNSCIPYCQSIIVSKTVARTGDSWNITDINNITRMNIYVKELKEIRGNVSAYEGLNIIVDQRVKIRTTLVGRPAPILSITPKERHSNNRTFVDRIFKTGDEITINFSIKNEGKATLRNMGLLINSSGLPILSSDEKLSYQLSELKVNETEIINVRFRAPYVIERRNYTISAIVLGTDPFGREYNISDHTNIVIRPIIEKIIEVKKFVPEKVHIGDYVYLTLYIKNNLYSEIQCVKLIDDLPAGFERIGWDKNLSNFTLKKNENKLVMFKIKAKRPGIYTFPDSTVEYGCEDEKGKIYTVDSNRLIVNGPFVELKKVGLIKGDNDIEIKIYAKNLGDTTAIVRLIDMIPKNGAIKPSLVVRPGRIVTFSYTINKTNITDMIFDKKIKLPAAEGTVYDQYLYQNDRYTQKTNSNELILNVLK